MASTTNYGWVKPDIGASNDVWGGVLNTDLDGIDSVVKGIEVRGMTPGPAGPTGATGATGPAGPTAVSANAGNQAVLGSDSLLFVPHDAAKYDTINPAGYQTAAQVTAAVPVASSTAPLMDGTAAIGVSPTWARADHVHPLASQVMGDNRIINGNFAINQRVYVSGTALATTVYGHDRWKAGPSGCTYTFTAALPDTTITITANTLTQVIEAGMIEGGVYTLSWTGTAQARIYQGTPTGSYAASPLITSSLPAGTNTIVEFNAGTVTRVKLEIGSVATAFNRQSLAKSMADCQRYYQITQWGHTGYLAAAGFMGGMGYLTVTMRAAPTMAIGATIGSDTNLTSVAAPDLITNNAFRSSVQTTAAGFGGGFRVMTANAEL